MQEDFQTKWSQMKAGLEAGEEDLTLTSSRAEHPAWFTDLATNARTKEEVMYKSCQSRVRGYMAKAQAQLREAQLKPEEEAEVERLVVELKAGLRGSKHHGGYFSRSEEEGTRICDKTGTPPSLVTNIIKHKQTICRPVPM